MGFPVGIVLAAINWFRMKMNDKAIIHPATKLMVSLAQKK